MDHLTALLRELAPWALTFTVGILAKVVHTAHASFKSLGETKFKADEAHEEVSQRVSEYERRYKTWLAHR